MSRDQGKRNAARAALDEVASGWIIGVGTGSTTDYFIQGLGSIRHRVDGAVASSVGTAERLRAIGIRLVDLNDVERLPLYVDGADEATRQRVLIKGGGGALTREKIIAQSSERFVCILDESKLVERLGRFPLPIEVIAMARTHVARELSRLGGRPVERAGITTDTGNRIIDVHDLRIDAPCELEGQLNQIPGVVTVGLFCHRPADQLLVGSAEGVTRI